MGTEFKRKNGKKKICYVVTISLTIESFFVQQLQYLASNGLDVTVVCSHDANLQKRLGDTVKFYPMNIPRGVSVIGSIQAIKHLTMFFRNEKFDLIQYSTPNAALYASLAAKRAGIEIRNYHLMGFRYFGASGIGRIILKEIEKLVCRNSTSIECVSKSNLEIGVQEGIFPRDKATVVWNGSTGGIDLKRFNFDYRSNYREEIRKKYNIEPDAFIFGFVGRITKDKGVNEILEAFFEIENAKLMIIGSPEAIDTLDKELYVRSTTNPNIVYTGNVLDVEKYYSAIDVLLFPSYREGFGNAVIEAAAMGTPAIVSNIPGPIDAIIKNRTALVVEAKNTQELFCAMKKLQNIDCAEMGKHACEYVKTHFDSNILCEHILERKLLLLADTVFES